MSGLLLAKMQHGTSQFLQRLVRRGLLQLVLTYAHGEAEKHCRDAGLYPEAFSGVASPYRKFSYVLVDFLRI